MFESWQILFGKDRATGEIAEDPQELPEEDENHIETPNLNDIETGVHSKLWKWQAKFHT